MLRLTPVCFSRNLESSTQTLESDDLTAIPIKVIKCTYARVTQLKNTCTYACAHEHARARTHVPLSLSHTHTHTHTKNTRERERQTDRQTQRQTERDRKTGTESLRGGASTLSFAATSRPVKFNYFSPSFGQQTIDMSKTFIIVPQQ